MRVILIFISSVILTVLLCGTRLAAQSKVKLRGKWDCVVPASDITEAGSEYIGVYESGNGEVQFSVYDKFWIELFGYSWSVSVRKSDILWDNTAGIYVQRTSDGTPYFFNGSVSGGTTYQQVTDIDTYFFSGYRGRKDVDIQYQLQGISVVIPAQSYSTTIIYTITSP